jgi:hypothetical protein
MALIFMDGFDVYADRDEVRNAGWGAGDVDSTFSTTAGINGGGALTIGGAAVDGWSHHIIGLAQPVTFYIGFWFKCSALPSATTQLMVWSRDGTGTAASRIIELWFYDTGELQMNTEHGSGTKSTFQVVVDTFYWIESEIVLDSGTGGSYDMRVNGSTITSETGINTSAGKQPNALILLAAKATGVVFDDVVLMDNSGSFNNSFLGSGVYIEALDVDADGGTVAWTRNTGANDWEMVDEVAADDDTTYVHATTAGTETRFGIPAPTEAGDTVLAVKILARMRKDDAGVKTVRGVMNVNGGGEEILFQEIGLTTDYSWFDLGTREGNDTGGTEWDTTNVGLTEIGVEIVV